MKNDIFLLTALFLLIFFSSCSHKERSVLLPELEHVEAIMYQHPDSALKVLEQMQMPKSSDHLNHATWCLFLSQAKYKNYIKQLSDSLINIAYDYFMNQDDPQRKALALYLEGVINEELEGKEKAVRFYLEAGDEVKKTTDYQLGHLIYVGLGDIYNSSRIYQYAKEAFEKAYNYATLSETDRYIMNSLLYFGRLYSSQRDWDNSFKYYERALETSTKSGDDRSSGRIMLEMSYLYRTKGDYQTALIYAQKEFRLKGEEDPDYYQSILALGAIYSSMNKVDSAYYYLTKALISNDLHIRKSANGTLVLLNRNAKKFEEAFKYVEEYQLYSEPV